MQPIISTGYTIFFEKDAYKALNVHLAKKEYSLIFVLVDENTSKYCLPKFLNEIETKIRIEILEIESGEDKKNIKICENLWTSLTELGADRKILLINLGGGVITDMGGFVAATYKRGIYFINVPTTLLCMVDASVGSKTGVDLGSLKNQIGLFADPQMVLIDPSFIKTLPQKQVTSGMAEIIKYGLSYDENLWKYIKVHQLQDIAYIIHQSISIKNEIVLQDKTESSLRKVLNFGHTIGHAIESLFLQSKEKLTLTHGESIAMGMICACYISYQVYPNFSLQQVEIIKQFIVNIFGKIDIDKKDYPAILALLKHDKKTTKGQVNFVLLDAIAHYKIDCKVSNDLIINALNYYIQ